MTSLFGSPARTWQRVGLRDLILREPIPIVNQPICIYAVASPPIRGFAFHDFSCLLSTVVQKCWMETSRNKQFVCFKVQDVLSTVMKSHAVPVCPPWDPRHQHRLLLTSSRQLLLAQWSRVPQRRRAPEGQQKPNTASRHLCHSPRFSSCSGHSDSSQHYKKGEDRTVWYFARKTIIT